MLGLVHEVFAPILASARPGSLREGDVGSLRRSYLELARTMLLSLQPEPERGRMSSEHGQKINSIYEESTMVRVCCDFCALLAVLVGISAASPACSRSSAVPLFLLSFSSVRLLAHDAPFR